MSDPTIHSTAPMSLPAPWPDSTGALPWSNPIPPSCLAHVPDLGNDSGKLHVCALYTGHDYVPGDHTGTFWHRCACGVKFTGADRMAAPDA